MTIVSGDVLRVSVNFVLGDGSQCTNVIHWDKHGISVSTDAAHVLAIELRVEAMYAEIAGMVKNDVVAGLCFVDLIEWVVDKWVVVENIGVFTPTFTPTGTGDMLPNQSSAFVVLKTSRPKTVGRKFLMPFEEGWQAGSFLVAGAVTDVVAWTDELLTNLQVDGPLNYLAVGVPRTAENTFLNCNVGVVTNVLGTQRRRRPGVGS